jgi:hypothetical protein
MPKVLSIVIGIAATLFVACDNPCEKLQKKVCEDPVYLKQNKRHCELLSDPERFEALPKESCTSILDYLTKR